MRVTFVTQEDPLYILPFFTRFFELNVEPIQVSGIFACRPMGNRKRSKLLRELLSLYGPVGFGKLLGLQVRERAMATFKGSSISHTHHSLLGLANSYGLPYEHIDNPNTSDNIARIALHQPDVLVSVACPFIFKAPLLRVPALSALNIHQAPLPRYKGMMPTFWQMFHGEISVGVTVHTMTDKLDEGEILYQDSTPIRPGDTMHDLIRRSKRHGADAMLQVLQQFASGSRPPAIPVTTQGSYFTFPTTQQMKAFRRRGLRAI
jgi:methionyl-tRNA formyltransferase